MLKPLLTEESYTLHGKEAQHFFINKLYTAARRGDKFRELVQDVFENVRSTICVGWDAAQKATHYLPMSTVLAGRPIDFQVEDPSPAQAPQTMDAACRVRCGVFRGSPQNRCWRCSARASAAYTRSWCGGTMRARRVRSGGNLRRARRLRTGRTLAGRDPAARAVSATARRPRPAGL